MPIHIHALSTAVPPHRLPQDLVASKAQVILGPKYPQFERLLKTFRTSGVEARYSVAPIAWFEANHSWSAKNALYMEAATELFVAVAQDALRQAGWRADEVDAVVTVSSTGIATPTLEAQAFREMGFRNDIERVPVFGLGCAGGVSGLSIARTQAAAQPGAKVLLVVVELCTLSFRTDRLQKADIIATVLFGDGAAAACLSSDPAPSGPTITLGPGRQWIWPDTLGIMGWEVDDIGLGVIFDQGIPEFATGNLAEAVDETLAAIGLVRGDVDRFVCHPGGAKVVAAIEDALDLPTGMLDAERETLRRYGNMSAPTVLFVLKAVLESSGRGRMMACALGPGFTAAFIPVHVEEVGAT
jgi:alkylresorcinol/alkylpyrone synthase